MIEDLRLELGDVTDGDGKPSDCEAVIFFSGLYDSPEITVNAPNAPLIAARIVELWNGAAMAKEPLTMSMFLTKDDLAACKVRK